MDASPDQTVSSVVNAARSSDRVAEALLSPLYGELRAIARAIMRGEAGTLQPTALVNEAYLKIAGERRWESEAHFIAVAAKAMRQVLIDHARAKGASKRGGDRRRVELHDDLAADDRGMVEVDDAMRRLASHDERASRVVELKFFGGLTNEEIADVLNIGRTTVASDWRHARAWLHRELTSDPEA